MGTLRVGDVTPLVSEEKGTRGLPRSKLPELVPAGRSPRRVTVLCRRWLPGVPCCEGIWPRVFPALGMVRVWEGFGLQGTNQGGGN